MTAGGSGSHGGAGDGGGSGDGGDGDGGERGRAGGALSPRLVVLAGRKGKPSLLPYVAVLLVLGLLGMLALLFLNTELNKGAFTIKQQKASATKLTQEAQQIQQSLAGLDGPGALAAKASELGMVPNGNPAFLAPNGSVLGSPSAAPMPTPTPPPTTPAPPAPTPTGTGR
ncbi:MAG: hypothetical protein HOV87_06515 [Catenulispora sp.]|nr:hypothetical protein [Catenulispora sp.]